MSTTKYRQAMVDADRDASRDYDNAVLSLASGALALSATFAHDIAPHPQPDSLVILGASWGLLTAALIAILVSLVTSQVALRRVIRDIDAEKDLGSNPGGRAATWTKILNFLALFALVLGLAALALFAWANLVPQTP